MKSPLQGGRKRTHLGPLTRIGKSSTVNSGGHGRSSFIGVRGVKNQHGLPTEKVGTVTTRSGHVKSTHLTRTLGNGTKNMHNTKSGLGGVDHTRYKGPQGVTGKRVGIGIGVTVGVAGGVYAHHRYKQHQARQQLHATR